MKKAILPVACSLLLLVTCLESPLSDVEFSNFDVIRAVLVVEKNFTPGSTSQLVRATLNDKNGYNIELKNGCVKVNNTLLTFNSTWKWYEQTNIPVVKDSSYSFAIMLSDSDTCVTTIRTPAAEFGTVTVPSPLLAGAQQDITWTDFTGGQTGIKITLTVHTPQDTVQPFKTILVQNITDNGRFTITSSMIDPSKHIGNGTLTLLRSATNTASPKLRSGSTVQADFQYSQSVTIAQ